MGDLESLLAETDAMGEEEIRKTLRVVARRAWEARGELNRIVDQLGAANADAERTYNEALLASYSDHPDRRVPHHRVIAETAAQDYRADVFALTHMERMLHRELEILDRLITSCQTQWKHLVQDDSWSATG